MASYQVSGGRQRGSKGKYMGTIQGHSTARLVSLEFILLMIEHEGSEHWDWS